MNTWWDGDEVPDSLRKADYRRRDFYTTREQLLDGSRQILTIRGPRQVGKTTLCGQLIESLIRESGVERERILYLTIENSQILSDPEGTIERALEVYRENVLQRSFRDVEGTVYVFVDEVQKEPTWADTLKYYTDTFSNLQFVATGSVSTLIKDDAGDTLIGRMSERVMLPMKFVDHVRFEEVLDGDTIYHESTELRERFQMALEEGDKSVLTGALARFYGLYQEDMPRLNSVKNEYYLKGGYPGILEEDVPESYQLLDTDLRNTVTGDLANVYDIEKPAKVLKILRLIAASTGGKVSKSHLAEEADVSRQTVDGYLDYLEEFYLISRCEKYHGSEYASGGWPKMYLQDVGLYNTVRGTLAESTLTDSNRMGPLFETVVCDHSRRLQFYLSGHQNADVYYWDNGGEVDFVLDGPDYLLPIEVKNGDSTSRNLRGLEKFVEHHDLPFGICVNNAGELDHEGRIVHVPAWIYLFLC